ncbi:Protein of unknown function DUF1810 [Ancylobacter novellus DSM 506]|uniref:DUF1810 domain-containing protein n=1 Tax=Ancylobacter novellus (strain ATCC 8093 / DSM 506 / JCM 20403 / CCM 1077 / IAM 12100 / NBRC 12443 / NCIMB 10456) TaxID=639283 RepID=D7A325_ANCN5|nr:DUF1810 domain-containing protein [Ancylobacter novellus]ADH87743.1 Protein of unknown function DUF1810 [Ancylobacter novellus DSM 506]
MDDPYDLKRFVSAQETVFDTAVAELRAGRKRSHWMWFIFPQLRGLGRSPTAEFYGIGSLKEARAYLAHPVLGPRLERATQAVPLESGRSLHDIFGSPDDMKFRSSMTLFALACDAPDSVFRRALDLGCAGDMDKATLALLDEERA